MWQKALRLLVKDLEKRFFWIIRVDPKCNHRCPYKREKERVWGQIHREVVT